MEDISYAPTKRQREEEPKDIFQEIQELTQLLQKKIKQASATLERDKKAFEDQFPIIGELQDVIKLNVGGVKYETTLATLRKYPNSMLGSMFRYKKILLFNNF